LYMFPTFSLFRYLPSVVAAPFYRLPCLPIPHFYHDHFVALDGRFTCITFLQRRRKDARSRCSVAACRVFARFQACSSTFASGAGVLRDATGGYRPAFTGALDGWRQACDINRANRIIPACLPASSVWFPYARGTMQNTLLGSAGSCGLVVFTARPLGTAAERFACGHLFYAVLSADCLGVCGMQHCVLYAAPFLPPSAPFLFGRCSRCYVIYHHLP